MTHKMTYKKKLSLFAALALVCALLLTACQKPGVEETLPGAGSPTFASAAPTATPTPSPEPTPTPEPAFDPTPSPDPSGASYESWDAQGALIVSTVTPAPFLTNPPYVPPTPTPTPFVALKKGMKGDAVALLQRGLSDLGFFNGTVDGSYGTQTSEAVASFQIANGLEPDGVAGSRTIRTMNEKLLLKAAPTFPIDTPEPTATPVPVTPTPSPTPTISPYKTLGIGNSGSEVRALQERLKQLGYFPGVPNGIYAADTAIAISQFQLMNQLSMDSVAGPLTQEILYSEAAIPVSGVGQPIISTYIPNPLFTPIASTPTPTPAPTAEPTPTPIAELAPDTQDPDAPGESASPTTSPVHLYRLGSAGTNVDHIQTRLTELGYLYGNIARGGFFDQRTVEAVKNFQEINGLSGDGTVGNETWYKLFSEAAIANPNTPAPTPTPVPVQQATDLVPVATFSSTLHLNDTGDVVKYVQDRLRTLGYYNGPIDGIYSSSVMNAVRIFQTRNGLEADGLVGRGTHAALSSDYAVRATNRTMNYGTLTPGMSGQGVQDLQLHLISLGYLHEEPTGYYGDQTKAAVMHFQQFNGLNPDGVAGPATQSLLTSPTVKNADGATPNVAPTATKAPPTPTPTPVDITLRWGDSGTAVLNLQKRLIALGYMAEGAADGKYQAATQEAIQQFQSLNSLTVNGIADQKTQAAIASSAAAPKPTPPSASHDFATLNNETWDKKEFATSGTTQSNIGAGGIAAFYDNVIYYANGDDGGKLYARDANKNILQIYDKPARFIHAANGKVTFASDEAIIQLGVLGYKVSTFAQVGYVDKMALIGDAAYFLKGGVLYSVRSGGDPRKLCDGVNDFCVDAESRLLYAATQGDIRVLDEAGRLLSIIVNNVNAKQVLQCTGILHFIHDGTIYRVLSGKTEELLKAEATLFAFYRSRMYYIHGSSLYVADSNGKNAKMLDVGPIAAFSFIDNAIYAGSSAVSGKNRELSLH